MPIFDFQCQTCNHIFEELILTRVDDPAEDVSCPKCQGKRLKRYVGGKGVSFRLIGEGFTNRHHKDTGEFAD